MLDSKIEINPGTGKRWYYEQEIVKNDNNPQLSENNKKANEDPSVISVKTSEMCIRCGNRKIEINTDTGKPLSPTSPYYGLGSYCRKEQDHIKRN